MMEIVIATKNKGKASEFKQFFKIFGISVKSLLDFAETLPDIEETGQTFKENARLKAEGISKVLNAPVLADDSGLMIDALDGKPGIYSARYAGEHATDEGNMNKVLEKLEKIEYRDRTARFISMLAIHIPNKETKFAKGYCEGHIAISKQGLRGFGYDPIFVPKGFIVTMATLSANEKNQVSHRKHAIDALKPILVNLVQ